jgi:hypothetical protein
MARAVHLLHIGYSEATAAAMEPGFQLLDNRANLRPDWYEIWPIREWLSAQPLDEAALYGFFSPKLRAKTGLGAAELQAFAAAHPEAELLLFSPQPDVAMPFRSVFHGGERFNPGYLVAAQAVLTHVGAGVDLQRVVMDSRCSVFSNYLLATPRFWRQWLSWVEGLVQLAESGQLGLADATSYGAGAQRKVFVAEGFASLLAWGGAYRVAALSPFAVPWFSQFAAQRDDLLCLDALKMAYRASGRPEYLARFDQLAEAVIQKALRRA